MSGPYGEAADKYWRAGWRGVLPLPPAKKSPPPDGWTGHGAPYPSYADVQAWVEDRPAGNIALRLPENVIGIDVDAYGDKPGAATLAQLEAEHGPLPATWMSTSRDDGVSGIRLYRLPAAMAGLNWRGGFPGIEVIRAGHRYMVVAPSVHEDTGAKYQWVTPEGERGDDPPSPDDLPELPLQWVVALVKPYERTTPADLDSGQVGDWLRQLRDGNPCPPVVLVLDNALNRLRRPDGGSRHDIALETSRALAAFGGEGHAGVSEALGQLGEAFVAAATNPARGQHTRSQDEARNEYRNMLVGAVRLAAATNPTPLQDCDCVTDDDLADLAGANRSEQEQPEPGILPDGPELDVTNPAVAAAWLRRNLGTGPLAGMFQRGDDLVYTPREGEDGYIPLTGKERDSDGPAQIRIVTPDTLAAQITYRYRCYRVVMTASKNTVRKPALFPTAAARTAINALDQMTGLRRLRGVTHTPVVRPDGTILDTPGYDPDTKLLYLPDPDLDVPSVPDAPTDEQVRDALGLLDRMTGDFPFVTVHDRANFYGAMLTPLLRLITPPPYKLVAIGAPMPGSGKSLLAGILRIIHGGVFRSELPGEEAELRKQITAILDVTTGPVVVFDNVSGKFDSSTMAGLLTSDRWDDRRLGANDMVSRPNNRLWVLTGNNLLISGDLPRRTLWITIDPAMPDPHLRTGFAINNLEAWTRQHRGQIIAALLTIVRGWARAGMPRPAADRSDSYAGWCATLRGILTYAGVEGVFDHPDTVSDSTGDEDWAVFLHAVHRVFGERPWTVRELLESVNVVHRPSIYFDELPGNLGERASKADDARVVAKSLGMWLRNREGRWVDGLTVRKGSDTRENARTWQIVVYRAEHPRTNAGSAGSAGSSSNPETQFLKDDLVQKTGGGCGNQILQNLQTPHHWQDW